jgi:O-antigen/teichoic acid export membrane protein
MYGMAYLAQSIALLSLLFVFKGALSVSMIIALFSISYAVGFLISWAVSGWIFPSMPSVGVLRNSIRIGIPLAMGNLAENLLYVGFRYVLLWFGGASMLGGFSFAVDLAQRTIGVVINVASFALVPRTFKAIAESSYKEFRWLLIRGSVVAAALGVCCAVFVLAMDFLGVSKAFGIEAYSPEFFVIASIAVLVNRLKKLLFDPLLISKGKASLIPVSYAVVGMASLLVAFILVSLKLDVWVLPLYSLSFLFVGFGSYLAVRKLTV